MTIVQVGFFEVVAMPLFRSLVAVVPGAQPLLDAASDNYFIWRAGGKPGGDGQQHSDGMQLAKADPEPSKAGVTATVQLATSNGADTKDAIHNKKADEHGSKPTALAAQAP